MVIETKTPEETYELGRKMGQEAKPGQVICLEGDLGVGRTVIYPGVCSRPGNRGTGEQSHLYHCTAV